MDSSDYFTRSELESLGFASLGRNVFLDRTLRIKGAERISLGSNVRIDAFGVISAGSGGIQIGNYVHIGTHVFMAGAGRIEMHDFSGLSGKVSIYSSSDDYRGEALTNPMVPRRFRIIKEADVILERHVVVGAGSVILPGVILHEGASVGALTLVRKEVAAFSIVAGPRGEVIGKRKQNLLELERVLRDEES